jgi:adenosine kinase
MSSVKLLGMGNPLLDISANVPQDVLDKYGVKLNDAILAEEKHLPLYEELVASHEVDYIAGGATQNSIRVAQWMLGGDEYAGSTAYIGCIGDDKFGEQLTASAAADGVQVHYMVDKETPTGTCAVLVNGGERSLVANLAAANNYKTDHLHGDEAQALVSAASLYYSAGFFLTVSVDSMVEVGKQAAEAGKTYCLNLSAPFIVDFFGEGLDQVFPYCDFVFANETEAAGLGKKRGWGEDVSAVALKVASLPKASGTRPRIVVFTQGSDSTVVACGGVVTTYAVEALDKEKLVDTNGAGDAFVGGFLAGLLQGKDTAACVGAGHYAAREVIQKSGCCFPEKSLFTFA